MGKPHLRTQKQLFPANPLISIYNDLPLEKMFRILKVVAPEEKEKERAGKEDEENEAEERKVVLESEKTREDHKRHIMLHRAATR